MSISSIIVRATYDDWAFNVKYCTNHVSIPCFACPFTNPDWRDLLAAALKRFGFCFRQVEVVLNGVAAGTDGLLHKRESDNEWDILPFLEMDVHSIDDYNDRGDEAEETAIEDALPADHWWHVLDNDNSSSDGDNDGDDGGDDDGGDGDDGNDDNSSNDGDDSVVVHKLF